MATGSSQSDDVRPLGVVDRVAIPARAREPVGEDLVPDVIGDPARAAAVGEQPEVVGVGRVPVEQARAGQPARTIGGLELEAVVDDRLGAVELEAQVVPVVPATHPILLAVANRSQPGGVDGLVAELDRDRDPVAERRVRLVDVAGGGIVVRERQP